MELGTAREADCTIQVLLNVQDRLTRADANQNEAMLDYQLVLMDRYFAMGVRITRSIKNGVVVG